MPDIADDACIHVIRGIEHTDTEVLYQCLDCGRVHARLPLEQATPIGLQIWGARNGIPDIAINRYLRSIAA